MADKFTCSFCYRTFDKAWSDEEAMNEALDDFGADLLREPVAVVCDDCYEMILTEEGNRETMKPSESKSLNGGTQDVYKFDNGYGASVIRSSYSYGGDEGLFELGVIKFDDDGTFSLTYETPITDYVIGYLVETQIKDILHEIESL